MTLASYRTLGRSGLVVSPLSLGTMTFGQEGWGAGEDDARSIFDAYVSAGGNFIDTADVYADGTSEEFTGRFIREAGLRDDIVLATKFGFNAAASPLAAARTARGNPNAGGTGAKNIHRALDASLRRLGTDYVDLYWMHVWDGVTPVAEIVGTLGDLVRRGKIRYFGLSDMPAWLAIKAATIASERNVPGPIALQVEYSLIARDIESEHEPAAREAGMAVVPWSPLGGGFLTGKYRRDDVDRSGRLSGNNPFGDTKFADRNWDILDALRGVAKELDRPPHQIALAWLMRRRSVGSIVIGAKTTGQLAGNLAALDIDLSREISDRLSDASAVIAGFSASLSSPPLRRMIFGERSVESWDELFSA